MIPSGRRESKLVRKFSHFLIHPRDSSLANTRAFNVRPRREPRSRETLVPEEIDTSGDQSKSLAVKSSTMKGE